MDPKEQLAYTLLDFELLSKLFVGIGEVADITKVPQRQIRYWEEKGIITSINEGQGSTRRYDYLTVKKILLVKELINDGFTLDAAAKKVEDRMRTINEVFKKLSMRKE
jgi:DNA-binding transcriptional MerR regulator